MSWHRTAMAPGSAAASVAQPKSHLGGILAKIMRANGCTIRDQQVLAEMKSQGLGMGDSRAQALALYRGGYRTSNDGAKALRLTRWEPCRSARRAAARARSSRA